MTCSVFSPRRGSLDARVPRSSTSWSSPPRRRRAPQSRCQRRWRWRDAGGSACRADTADRAGLPRPARSRDGGARRPRAPTRSRYRRAGSFSSARLVIHSRSPQSWRTSTRGSVSRRLAISLISASVRLVSREARRGGSSSRITRSISRTALRRSALASNGSAPTSSS